jgi:hypothetical protein
LYRLSLSPEWEREAKGEGKNTVLTPFYRYLFFREEALSPSLPAEAFRAGGWERNAKERVQYSPSPNSLFSSLTSLVITVNMKVRGEDDEKHGNPEAGSLSADS